MTRSKGKRKEEAKELELGFHFHPAEPPVTIGHPKLDIRVYSEPTGKHFDPVWVRLPVSLPHTDPYHLIITHPWRGYHRYRVNAGRIILRDRIEKVVEAYSFGGTLEICPQDEFTCLQVRSSAPIFSMQSSAPMFSILNNRGPSELFIEEFELILAIIRAELLGSKLDFESRLARIDPFDLFCASIVSIEDRLHEFQPLTRDDQYWKTIHSIHRIKNELHAAGQWPILQPSLTELLGTSNLVGGKVDHTLSSKNDSKEWFQQDFRKLTFDVCPL